MGEDVRMKRKRAIWAFLFSPFLACGGRVSHAVGIDASIDVTPLDAGNDARLSDDACKQLLSALEPLRAEARKCCSFCRPVQCDVSIDDVCCSLSATGATATGAKFAAAVQDFKAKCTPICTQRLCPRVPSQNCDRSSGLCQP